MRLSEGSGGSGSRRIERSAGSFIPEVETPWSGSGPHMTRIVKHAVDAGPLFGGRVDRASAIEHIIQNETKSAWRSCGVDVRET